MNEDSDNLQELPEGWSSDKLGNIAELITKGSTPTSYGFQFHSEGINFVKIENIKDGKIVKENMQYIDQETYDFLKRSQLHENDILFSLAGSIGVSCIITKNDLPANTNQALALIRGINDVFSYSFLLYQLKSNIARKVKEKARGGAMDNISLGDLRELTVLIPPPPEQHCIVAKIEELFAEVKTIRSSLEKVQLLLQRFRQSVLASAFRGELVLQDSMDEPASVLLERIQEEWKQKMGKKYKEPVDTDELPGLPEGWVWSSLNELADTQPGFACGNKNVQDGLIHLRMNNISDDCRLNMDLIRKVPLDFKIEKYLLKKGDLLFCHTNSSKLVGKNAIFNLDGDYTYSNHLTRLRVDSNFISSKWLWCILTIYWKEGRFENDCKNWVNQSTLPNDKLIQFSIPLPPLIEQHRIVAKIEELFALADEIEQSVQKGKKRTDYLEQSILAKAFRGELVPHDPNDEPASVLLQRIKAEREKTKKSKNGRK